MSIRHSAVPSLRAVLPLHPVLSLLLAGALALLAGGSIAAAQSGTAVAIGPDGGPLDALAASRDAKTLYASSPLGGFFRSTDGGGSWQRTGDNPAAAALSLAIDSARAETVFARTNTGLFRSTDGGATWQGLNRLVPDVAACEAPGQRCGVPTALLADLHHPGTLFAAFADVGLLFRSRDSGATWQRAVSGLERRYVHSLAAHAKEPGHLFAGTDEGVYESLDGGDRWTLSSSRPRGVVDLAVDAGPGGALAYAVGTTPRSRHHPPCTTVQRRAKASGPFVSIDGVVGPRTCAVDVESDPALSGVAYLADTAGVLRTTNGGKSWSVLNDRSAKGLLAPSGSPGTLLVQAAPALQDGRAAIRKSIDGGLTWRPADHGLVVNRVPGLVADPSAPGTLFAQVGNAELHRTTDGGATWRRVDSLPAQWSLDQVVLDPLTRGTLYAYSLEGVWKSTDRGATWVSIVGVFQYGGVLAFAADPNASGTLYAVRDYPSYLYRTTDGGQTWRQIGDSAFRFANLVVAPAAAPGRPATLFGTAYRKGLDPYAWDYTNEIRRSTDGGLTWETLLTSPHAGTPYTALLLPAGRPQAVIVAETETGMGDQFGVPLRGSVHRSTDNGRTWKLSRLGTDKPPVLALALDPRNPDRLFAASTRGRLYASIDGGANWSPLAVHLPSLDVDTLQIDPRDSQTLYAGLDGGSVYRITLER